MVTHTTVVDPLISSREGQDIFLNSDLASEKNCFSCSIIRTPNPSVIRMAGQAGFEPATRGFGDRRSTIRATALQKEPALSAGPGITLLSFLMQCVLAAPPALFLDLDFVRLFPFVARFVVIAALALGTGQRYLFTHETLFLR